MFLNYISSLVDHTSRSQNIRELELHTVVFPCTCQCLIYLWFYKRQSRSLKPTNRSLLYLSRMVHSRTARKALTAGKLRCPGWSSSFFRVHRLNFLFRRPTEPFACAERLGANVEHCRFPVHVAVSDLSLLKELCQGIVCAGQLCVLNGDVCVSLYFILTLDAKTFVRQPTIEETESARLKRRGVLSAFSGVFEDALRAAPRRVLAKLAKVAKLAKFS